MKKSIFLLALVMFFAEFGCKGCHNRRISLKKSVKQAQKSVNNNQKSQVKPTKAPPESRGSVDMAFDAVSEVCQFIPTRVDALFFAPKKEAKYMVHAVASGIPATTGVRREGVFMRNMKKRFGIYNLKNISSLLVVVSGNEVLVFAKGASVDLAHRETYTSGPYKFAAARLDSMILLTGLYRGWTVTGRMNTMLKLAARRPGDAKIDCKLLRKQIVQKIGPNIDRDPFNTAEGTILPLSTVIFWDSSRGVRVMMPEKGRAAVTKVKAFAAAFKQDFLHLQAESDAGVSPLHPVHRMKKADLLFITTKSSFRAGMYMMEARGSLADAVLAVFQQRLRPFFGNYRTGK